MDKVAFVTRVIQHEADFPFVKPISLSSAQLLLDSTFPEQKPADITAEEVVAIWNRLINDPDVVESGKLILG